MTRSACVPLLLAALLAGCGGPSAEDRQREAQDLLGAGKAAEAAAKADAALADAGVTGDAALAWRFESIRLEALAAQGKGADVAQSLERLSGTYSQQINASMYRSLADKVAAAKDVKGAVEILTSGDKKFPADHASFNEAIQKLQAQGDMDPETLSRLQSLGYLGGGADEAPQAPAPGTPPEGGAAAPTPDAAAPSPGPPPAGAPAPPPATP